MSAIAKLLVVIPTLSAGGAEGFMVNLALNLIKKKVEVRFYLTAGVRDGRGEYLLAKLNAAGIQVAGRAKRPSRSIRNIFTLAKIMRVWQPDIVQANLYPAEVITAFSKNLLPKKNRPIFVRRLANTKFPIPSFKPITFWLFNQYDAVIACSPAAKKTYLDIIKTKTKNDDRLLRKPFKVIRNGCSINNHERPDEGCRKKARREWGIAEGDFVIGHVGRMTFDKDESASGLKTSQKAHDVILHTFSVIAAQNTDTKLFLLGDGPGRPDLEKLAQRLNISDKTVFLGIQDSPFLLLSISDVFFFPSRYEGLPNALLEAATFGLPVVASDIPEINEIKLNADWQLCEVDDVAAFAKALIYVKNNKEQLTANARASTNEYRQTFSLSNCAQSYRNFFECLLAMEEKK